MEEIESIKKNIRNEYDIGYEIAKGSYGSVRSCRSKANGQEFACKTLSKRDDNVRTEISIMQHLSGNPSLVNLYAVYEDFRSFHLVMDLCNGGDLFDRFEEETKFSELRAAGILQELMLGIKYCHDMGVVHKDVKPENILLTSSGKIKLADFGLAERISPGQSLSSMVGSPIYVAPEVFDEKYSEKVDIWSAGVILHTLLVGYLPFDGDTADEIYEEHQKMNLDLTGEIWESISNSARDLIMRMLTKDVALRLSADEVLRHPWFLLYTDQLMKPTTRLETEKQGKRLRCSFAPTG
ncbi:hypothetical protein IFM89_000953 [Coptis chinensis]|uniref:Protein kinase domain-containing protein n=1 Tax=Coptis chinensis TaxID=261450 RepID=A0A835IKP6_9MAGN|nr:hypothetical protein IFM89_000953 [Coptis chinensis]